MFGAQNFLGKFGDIRATFLRAPKNLPGPAPVAKRVNTSFPKNVFLSFVFFK